MDWGPDGFLYGPIWTSGTVVRVNVETGEMTVVADGFKIPSAAKFNAQEQLHVLDQMTGEVVRVDIKSGVKETVATLPPGLDNLSFNAQDRLFVSSADDGFIVEVLATGETRLVSPGGMITPSGVAVLSRADGESVWVVPDIWTLREFDGETGRELGTERTFIGYTDLVGIGTLTRDGENLLMASWSSNAVQVWSPQTRKVVESYMDFAVPINAIRFQGDLVVAELGGTAGAARVVQAKGQDPTLRTTLADAADGLLVPTGLAATDRDLWVSDWATGNVMQIVANGKSLEQPKVVATGLTAPEGMAVATDGGLLVLETGIGRLSYIDVATGKVSTVAEGMHVGLPAPQGLPPFWVMTGIAVGPSGTIYVTDDAGSALYRIEPVQ